ncbi:MAG: hypothetical protein AAGF95_11660 [Chloroflexota bacterium]
MSPAPLLLFLIATISMAVAHVLWGQRWVQIPLFWFAAFAGALVVYSTGIRLPWELPTPAGVPVLEVILGSWLIIIIASRVRL